MKQFLPLFLFLFSLTAKAQFSGNALDFDGTNDMVVCSTVPAMFSNIATNDFTIEAWVNPRGSAFQRIFFAQPSTTNFVSLGTSTGNVIYFYVIKNSTTYSIATTASIPQNQWTHVAARWTASTNAVEVFFNGVLQAGANGGSSSTGTSGLMVLGSRPGGAQYFNGGLDEIRVWNEARTQCEIINNMNNSITGVQTNLLVNYNFNQGTGGGNNTGTTTLPDISGNAFNGTATNFTLTGSTSNWIVSAATVTTSGNPVGGVSVSQSASICSGGNYTFPDATTLTNITTTTSHISTLQTTAGCDSIITTTVNINPTYSINQSAAVCSGGNYTFPDSTVQTNITSQVTHTSMLLTSAGCDSIINSTVNVNPTYSVSESATVCSGGNYTFPDATTQTNITAQVTHTSMLQTTTGCDSTITTTVNVNPVYSFSAADSVCSGSSYTFPDGTTMMNITSPVMHTNMLLTIAGCDSIISTNISIIQVDTTVSETGFTLTANAAGATYQWLDCNNAYAPIAGETNASFAPVMGGNYAVAVTMNGCTDTSSCYSVPLSVNELNPAFTVSVYPNPAHDFVTIETGKISGGTITLSEISGAVVRTIHFSGTTCSLDMDGLANGVYMINVFTPEGKFTKRIVKE
jgi:hypothetical protein